MQHKASILRLKNEIKYLYIKQQQPTTFKTTPTLS
jgi:hypothetical protein